MMRTALSFLFHFVGRQVAEDRGHRTGQNFELTYGTFISLAGQGTAKTGHGNEGSSLVEDKYMKDPLKKWI